MVMSVKRVVVWFMIIGLILGLPQIAKAESLMIDDFNDGEKPNNLGGDFGTWDGFPADPTQGCKMVFYTDQETENICVGLDYDVDSPNPAYNGFWMFLQGIDISKYKMLTISVKGDAIKGYASKIKLELKNNKGEIGKYLLTGIKDYWQDFEISLSDFKGLSDYSSTKEFVIVFDDVTSTDKDGAIYIDDIYLK